MYRLTNKPAHRLQEKELIESLKNGQAAAFGVLVREQGSRVYNTILGFVQQPEDAEELTQDVFVRIFQHIAGFREEAGLRTWIYRIAVTTALDFLRRQKRRKRSGMLLSLFGEEAVQEVPEFHHPGVAAEQKEDAALLFRAVRGLPEQQQAAFLLQKLEGLSLAEIAAALDTTPGAVESLLHRAKAGLRKTLENHFKKAKE